MATAAERRAFGTLLRDHREARELTLDQLADELGRLGEATTASNIGAWERGQYAPRRRSTVAALERALGADGELARALGITLALHHPDQASQLAALNRKLTGATPAELARIEAYLDGLFASRE